MSTNSANTSSFNKGYFNLAGPESPLAAEKRRLDDFIARFKHSLLFTPKLVLADGMVFTQNFRMAYRKDPAFRELLREDLVDVAYFEKFADGRAFTLAENRKFREYLRRNRDSRFDPRDPNCPTDPYDADLDSIQSRAGRLLPNGASRDPLFTEFADKELENGTLQPVFGKLYEIYRTAYRRMRSDVAAQNSPLGGVHFDEANKSPGTDNIFDYMTRAGSLESVPRERLVAEYGDEVARLHRVLAVKAQLRLLPGVHAILPPELRAYKMLTVTTPSTEAIDKKDSQSWNLDMNLSAVNTSTLSSLTQEEVIELRKAGADFFEIMRKEAFTPKNFRLVCSTLQHYVEYLNDRLAFKAVPPRRGAKAKMRISVLQGKIAGHRLLRDDSIAVIFKVIGGVAHSMFSHSSHFPGVESMLDVPLKETEAAIRAAAAPSPLEGLVKDVKAQMTISAHDANEKVMQYE